jgi:hypothetical protein
VWRPCHQESKYSCAVNYMRAPAQHFVTSCKRSKARLVSVVYFADRDGWMGSSCRVISGSSGGSSSLSIALVLATLTAKESGPTVMCDEMWLSPQEKRRIYSRLVASSRPCTPSIHKQVQTSGYASF